MFATLSLHQYILIFALICLTKSTTPSQADYDTLSQDLSSGFVVTPNDDNFSKYSTNSMSTFDDINIPLAIIMCHCEQDIIITMQWIQNYLDSITFRIRSGGHSFGGYSKSSNAIIIDLSEMNNVNIIKGNKLSIESGIILNEFEEWKSLNLEFKRTVPHGLCPDVGFGGYATGGGIGLTTRKWGVLSDYIYEIRIILCDGSLWQIFEDNTKKSKCIQTCNQYNNIKISNDELQSLLFAVKGSGGGNFGIITRYYFNTINEEISLFPMYFNLIFSLSTRDNIYNAFKTFENILINDFADNDNFGIALFITPNGDDSNNDLFPYNFQIRFMCIYLSPNNEETIFYEMINKINEYMESLYIESLSVITTQITLNEIYREHIFPVVSPGDPGEYELNGYPSTRLIYKSVFDDENYINILTDYWYENVITNPLIQSGVINTFFIESLGGNIRINNEKTSFPIQNREALAVAEIFFIIPPQIPKEQISMLSNTAKSLRDNFDNDIMSVLFGNNKYINYLDDISNNLTNYYSTDEINKLSQIQNIVDPNRCFKFELGINGGNK